MAAKKPTTITDTDLETLGREAFGAYVRNMRVKAGWNQTELAEALGVTQQTVSRWEAALIHPGPEYNELLAEVLGGKASDYDKALRIATVERKHLGPNPSLKEIQADEINKLKAELKELRQLVQGGAARPTPAPRKRAR